jgi:hypothetical protein
VHCTFDECNRTTNCSFHRDQTWPPGDCAESAEDLGRVVHSIVDPDTIFSWPSIRDAVEYGVIEGPESKTGVQALLTASRHGGRSSSRRGARRLCAGRQFDRRCRLVDSPHIKYGAAGQDPRDGFDSGTQGELLVWSYDDCAPPVTRRQLATPVMAHCLSSESVRIAVEGVSTSCSHASFMDERALQP